ncbi:hypothetical protein LWI29_010743 [Acer saccharum]|uniref:PGG domain-containing protein n=1 Tax=Acer saccharum TaxID=4024 RepID=A0AA39VZA8_ACESA|nr:hypothetical protein LWI29_010743 [Acer saccharum]
MTVTTQRRQRRTCNDNGDANGRVSSPSPSSLHVAVAVVFCCAGLGGPPSWMAELDKLDEVSKLDWLGCNTQHRVQPLHKGSVVRPTHMVTQPISQDITQSSSTPMVPSEIPPGSAFSPINSSPASSTNVLAVAPSHNSTVVAPLLGSTNVAPKLGSTHSMVTRYRNGIFKPKAFSSGLLAKADPTTAKAALQDSKWMTMENNPGSNSFKLIDSLYSAAADGNIDKFQEHAGVLDQILTPNGNTILHIHITARPPSKSILLEKGDFVSEILGMRPDLLWKENKKGETLLHMAARHGHFDVAKYLLEECKKIPYRNYHDDQELGITPTRRMLQMTSHKAKDTALHEAVLYNHVDVVQLLTKADCKVPYDANSACETPLYLAAERGYAEVLKKILSTCIISPADHGPYDRTALHVAVIRNDEDMVKTLLEAGERFHNNKHELQDQQGWTPLHFAAHLGYIEILKMLLNVKDRSVAYKADKEGKTALHVAAGVGKVNIKKELISKCPSCCELVDKRGQNVLHFALESGNKKAVKLVLKNPWLGNLINEKDENGNTPFLHAASIGYYDMRHRKVDMQVFNHQNHNAKDIIWGNNTASLGLEILRDRLVWLEKNHNYSPGRCMKVSENDSIGEVMDKGNTVRSKSIEDGKVEDEGKMSSKSNDGKRKDRIISNIMVKPRENELVAATLIATVTFAVGFTVPGGFVADKGPNQGAAILTRNTAFGAFVILNTMAMYFSCQAVLHNLYALCFGHVLNERILFEQWRFRHILIAFAMSAMVGAFLSGTYAVLHNNKNLAISACVVPFVVFGFIQVVSNRKTLSLIYSRLWFPTRSQLFGITYGQVATENVIDLLSANKFTKSRIYDTNT